MRSRYLGTASLKWSPKLKQWVLNTYRNAHEDPVVAREVGVVALDKNKSIARRMAVSWVIKDGRPWELIVHNKDGRIGRGHGSRATYPRSADPRRSKG